MPFITIKVTGLDQVINHLNGIVQELPDTKREIHREAADIFYKDAVNNVHVITGRTKKSIKIDSVTDKEATISAGFGAKWEERRAGTKPPPFRGTGTGPHKTFTEASKKTKDAFPRIIVSNINKLFQRHRSPI